jgi:hypothetical protein
MNPKQTRKKSVQSAARSWRDECIGSCKKIVFQVMSAKDAIFAEWRDLLYTDEKLLRLTLNEAEALAWETDYPQLVFPALAMEKVEAVLAWKAHQQQVRRKHLLWQWLDNGAFEIRMNRGQI